MRQAPELARIVRFYQLLELPHTPETLRPVLPSDVDISDRELSEMLAEHQVRKDHAAQWQLRDAKMDFLKRSVSAFRHIPFIHFVCAAGSVAMGNVHADSDLDVIVGVQTGRIFTARFCAVVCLELFGLRKKRGSTSSSDKLCLNHFVTPSRYTLQEPYNLYWEQLYRSIEPVYGVADEIERFFAENTWAKRRPRPASYFPYQPSWIGRLLKRVLSGKIGDGIEHILGRWQKRSIARHKEHDSGIKPRLIYSDEELEFHVDTKRIEDWMQAL